MILSLMQVTPILNIPLYVEILDRNFFKFFLFSFSHIDFILHNLCLILPSRTEAFSNSGASGFGGIGMSVKKLSFSIYNTPFVSSVQSEDLFVFLLSSTTPEYCKIILPPIGAKCSTTQIQRERIPE